MTRERRHAGEAAGDVERVAAQRRQRRHLAPHALRHRREQRRDDDEQERQQHRALDQHDALVGRAAREIDAAGGRDGDLEPEVVDRQDHRRLQRREPPEQPRARLDASRQPTPMPRKLASRMKFEK